MGTQASGPFDEKENINLINCNLSKLPFSPSEENKTKYLYLSGNNMKSFSKNMKNIVLIDLSDNKIGPSFPPEISDALSSYSNLKTLYLKKNQLENLNNFENSNVDTIFLIQNNFRELPYQFFSKFPQLKTIYLDCNFISAFSKQKSESITSLSLSLNCIQTIEVSTLNLPQLMILNLAKNNIHNLPNNFSKSFPNLQNLDLSDNFISEIPDDESYFPKTLNELNLSHNLIEKVPKSVTSLPTLLTLDITHNKITALPQLNLSITRLLASYNKISQIEKQELNFLNEIQLDYNEITCFPTEIEHREAQKIYLSHNKIKEVNSSSFTINNNLTVIDLSFNQIESIPKDIFECHPCLQSFSVHFNKITAMPSEISFCQNLLILNISHNPIKKLPKLPRSLALFFASNCLLESFGMNSFIEATSEGHGGPSFVCSFGWPWRTRNSQICID